MAASKQQVGLLRSSDHSRVHGHHHSVKVFQGFQVALANLLFSQDTSQAWLMILAISCLVIQLDLVEEQLSEYNAVLKNGSCIQRTGLSLTITSGPVETWINR